MAANSSPEVKAILKLTPDLTTALSNEPFSVANKLLSQDLISDEVYSKVLGCNHSATEKAAIMIESARKVIKLTPSKFTGFLEILSELSCARLVENLRSTYQSESALASQIIQESHQFSTPSNSVTVTGAMPLSLENTVSLASSMTGPSPSQMMQYQERSLAHHGIGMQHTRMGQANVSHPKAATAPGMQPVSQLPMGVAHSQMGMMQLPNVYAQQQAQYMGYNTMVMQAHGDIGPSSIHAGRLEMYPHMIPHTTPPHHMHSRSQMPQGEMMHPLYIIGWGRRRETLL